MIRLKQHPNKAWYVAHKGPHLTAWGGCGTTVAEAVIAWRAWRPVRWKISKHFTPWGA
jgi:hypothetical protein